VNVPLHLPDSLEYKFLGCIPDDHQLRIASNGIRMTAQVSPLQCRQGRARRGVGGEGGGGGSCNAEGGRLGGVDGCE
jgi:hypothetical protein